jgi:RNA polymerase sigma-70 factor (ECF subfamily)
MEPVVAFSETAFIEDLREGNDRAWEDFFRRHDALIQSVTSWSKWHFDPVVRDDIAQKIRAELPRSIGQFKGDSSLEYFVKQISIRRCIDEVRRQVRNKGRFVSTTVEEEDGESRELQLEAGPDFDPVQVILKTERARSLRRVLEELDETCRAAIRQFYLEDLSYKEMAEANGITVNTVGSRLSKCLNKLRGMLAEKSESREDISPEFD